MNEALSQRSQDIFEQPFESIPITAQLCLRVSQPSIFSSRVHPLSLEHHCSLGSQDSIYNSLRFSHDDQEVAVGCSDGTLRIYESSSMRLRNTITSSDQYEMCVSVRFRRDEYLKSKVLLTANMDGMLREYHTLKGTELGKVQLPPGLLCMDLRGDDKMVCAGGKDKHVYVVDQEAQRESSRLLPGQAGRRGHTNQIFYCGWLRGNTHPLFNSQAMLVTAAWDSNILLWDTRQAEPVQHIYGPTIQGEAIDFQDGLLLTGSFRNRKQLEQWDIRTFRRLNEVQWYGGQENITPFDSTNAYITCCQYNPRPGHLRSLLAGVAGEDPLSNELRLFQQKAQGEQEYVPVAKVSNCQGIYTASFANQSNLLAMAGTQGLVNIFKYSQK